MTFYSAPSRFGAKRCIPEAYVSSYIVLEGKAGKKLQDRRMQTLGMGLRFFSLGQIQYTDEQGNALQTVRPNELELTFAYARKLGKRFSTALAINRSF